MCIISYVSSQVFDSKEFSHNWEWHQATTNLSHMSIHTLIEAVLHEEVVQSVGDSVESSSLFTLNCV